MSESTPADFDDAFDEWIAGATISRRSVPIYGKPGLYAEFQQLERELEVAQEVEGGDTFAGSESSKIKERMHGLYDEWVESKSTWFVRALSDDEIEAVDDQEPKLVAPVEPTRPVAPRPLPDKHTEQQAKSYTVAKKKFDAEYAAFETAYAPFAKEFTAYAREKNLRYIAAAVEKIEFANGRTADGITVEQLRDMRERLGSNQIDRLVAEAIEARKEEPVLSAPFSPSDSESDPT